MCGRYYTDVDREEMQNIIDTVNRVLAGNEALQQMKTGEIFPTNFVPVFISSNKGATPAIMKWGFPGFTKPNTNTSPSPIINARSETILDKPTFSRYIHQRCLVPATSYFEWGRDISTSTSKKIKYSFHPKNNQSSVFWMAAVYKHPQDVSLPMFTILTMDASESVSSIHDRMPVILRSKESRRAWMNDESDLASLFHNETEREMIYSPAV